MEAIVFIILLIKTATKFSNKIGYQQPDLSIKWTVYVSWLQLDSKHHFARAVVAHFHE